MNCTISVITIAALITPPVLGTAGGVLKISLGEMAVLSDRVACVVVSDDGGLP